MIGNEKDVLKIMMEGPTVNEAGMKVLVTPEDGWDSHVMRLVELGEGGYSPKHTHPWPHINYMIEGEGVLLQDGKEVPVSAGSYAYVPAGELHQFRNTGKGIFKFICIVPKEGHQ